MSSVSSLFLYKDDPCLYYIIKHGYIWYGKIWKVRFFSKNLDFLVCLLTNCNLYVIKLLQIVQLMVQYGCFYIGISGKHK